MNRRHPMKKTIISKTPRKTADGRSTAELFLVWLSMPELGTPVHGPAALAALGRKGRRPGKLPRLLAHR